MFLINKISGLSKIKCANNETGEVRLINDVCISKFFDKNKNHNLAMSLSFAVFLRFDGVCSKRLCQVQFVLRYL